ncbi:MAG: alpha/beta hydrolase [Pseudomonadales bacterium]|nr:alpha/beta hydrolase [Pseudomonadales bacterium]
MSSYLDLEETSAWAFPFEENAFLRGVKTEGLKNSTVHFLHGNGLCGKTYWPMLKGLTEQYALMLHDCVGHGDSDPGRGFISWEQSAEHAYDVIQYDISRGVLTGPLLGLGHSFGGVLTLKLAAKYPELFHSVIVMDPIIMPEAFIVMSADMPNPLADKTRKRRNHWDTPEQAFTYFRGKMAYKDWSDESLNGFIAHALCGNKDGGLSLKCPPSVEADIFSSRPEALWDDIRRINVPTTILYGDNSYPFMESACQQAGENPHVTIEKLEGSHCFMLENTSMACERVLFHYERMMTINTAKKVVIS